METIYEKGNESFDIEETVKRAQSGDMDAFETIVSKHEKSVYRLAFRYMSNEQDALDACQDTFLRVYKNIGNFKFQSSLSTWLYKITSNVCLDLLRSKKRMHLPLDSEEDVFIPNIRSGEETDPEKKFDIKEFNADVNNALEQLSIEHKQAVILRDIHGYTYEEIGMILELEQGTVKSRIARGRKKLRDILAQNGNIPDRFSSKALSGR